MLFLLRKRLNHLKFRIRTQEIQKLLIEYMEICILDLRESLGDAGFGWDDVVEGGCYIMRLSDFWLLDLGVMRTYLPTLPLPRNNGQIVIYIHSIEIRVRSWESIDHSIAGC